MALRQVLMKAKRKTIGPKTPMLHFVESPLPDVTTLSIEEIDASNPFLYRQGKCSAYFKRLRDEAPVHYQKNSPFGPYWSITRFDDILYVDKNHQLFSSEPQIVLGDPPDGLSVETVKISTLAASSSGRNSSHRRNSATQ